ncbi:MAG: hypothetical protein WDZ47_01105 [Bacteroidales bacterium]
MVPISAEIWEEILFNQSLPLIGTNEPDNGNGYHDGISWRMTFRPKKEVGDSLYSNPFYSIFLRDLGYAVNPSYSSSNKFEKDFKISNCSQRYHNTLLHYLTNSGYYGSSELLRILGQWGENLCYKGIVIFEIKGWYDNISSQFYGFELNQLDIDYCKIRKDDIIYNAPYEIDGNKEIFKKVRISKSKCIIIEFPNELGGYKEFKRKVEKIKRLGSKYNYTDQPGASLEHMKNWDKQFNKIISDWGASNKIEDVTDFYQILSVLRFNYSIISCVHEIVDGLKQLIKYLNEKLKENATIEFSINHYDKKEFKEIQNKWMKGELSFKEVNQIILELNK